MSSCGLKEMQNSDYIIKCLSVRAGVDRANSSAVVGLVCVQTTWRGQLKNVYGDRA